MVEFDAEAYNAATNLFKMALTVRKSLPSLIAQIRDSADMLGSPAPDGMPKAKGGDNRTEQRMVKHADLMARMHAKQREYEAVVSDCEAVVEDMEARFDDNAAFLRHRFMQGMSQAKAADACGYVSDYGKEKEEIALVHAAKSVRALGLVLKYS